MNVKMARIAVMILPKAAAGGPSERYTTMTQKKPTIRMIIATMSLSCIGFLPSVCGGVCTVMMPYPLRYKLSTKEAYVRVMIVKIDTGMDSR